MKSGLNTALRHLLKLELCIPEQTDQGCSNSTQLL